MCVMRGLMVVVLVVVMGVGEEELVRVIVWGGAGVRTGRARELWTVRQAGSCASPLSSTV